jgi:hypothetical protein
MEPHFIIRNGTQLISKNCQPVQGGKNLATDGPQLGWRINGGWLGLEHLGITQGNQVGNLPFNA